MSDRWSGAPPEVREAAAYFAATRWHRWGWIAALTAGWLAVLAVPGIGHDAFGWSEGASMVALFGGGLAGVGLTVFTMRGPLRAANEAARKMQTWARLREVGTVAPADGPTERLRDRIAALAADRPEVVRAATLAADQAARLEAERAELVALVEADPALGATLGPARERIETTVATLRADLAAMYAALVELGPAAPVAQAEALARLAAEAEVERASRSRAAAAARVTTTR